MGKNITIYFDDECVSLIEKVEGKGTLINQLVKDYFGNDIENLKRKSNALNLQLEEVNNKIEKFRKLKEENELNARRRNKQTEASIQKDNISRMIAELLQEEKISLEEWESLFDLNGIKVKEALEVCKRFKDE